MIGHAGKAGNFARAIQLFDDLQAASLSPDVWTYTSLINACQTCGNQWREGIAFFKQMEVKGQL